MDAFCNTRDIVDLRNELKPNPVLLGDVDGGAAAVVVVAVFDAEFAVVPVATAVDSDNVFVVPPALLLLGPTATLPNRARVC